MKLYVEMDELEFEKYKEALRKPKTLTDYSSAELSLALLNVIEKEGGRVESNENYDPLHNVFINKTAGRLTKSTSIISLIVEKISNK